MNYDITCKMKLHKNSLRVVLTLSVGELLNESLIAETVMGRKRTWEVEVGVVCVPVYVKIKTFYCL